MNNRYENATFSAGCFWGVEKTFRSLKGVKETMVGYAGGHLENPTYEHVCTGKTGHAESVRVVFDPHEINYNELLTAFWALHDPTQLNKQGPDVGDQYRSIIFYHTPVQMQAARKSKLLLEQSAKYSKPIVTEILPAPEFYKAEEYHQRYLEKKGVTVCH